MNPIYLMYKFLSTGSVTALLPLIFMYHHIRGGNFNRLHQRLGRYPKALRRKFQGRPRVWLHAVSVGEVGVAVAISEALRVQMPHCRIALSTTTEQGNERAQALLGDTATCFYAPIDATWPTQKALKMVQPDVLALLETEIWPNLIVSAHEMGIRTAIVNGRISVRTIDGYRKIRALMRYTLSHVDTFSMISRDDGNRLCSVGAPENRVVVNGNAKFDGVDPHDGTASRRWAMDLFGLQEDALVFVAGSTRHPEEQFLLDAYMKIRQEFPHSVLIIAPRHTNRVDQIVQWVTARGLQCQRRTDLGGDHMRRTAPVVVLDTIGELFDTYGVATLVFCGGSLVPKGGQNILEPAMWGKPILYGPSMEDFADAQQYIQEAGGGVMVCSADEMAVAAMDWLRHPRRAQAVGNAARHAILPHRGAAQKHAAVIRHLLQGYRTS